MDSESLVGEDRNLARRSVGPAVMLLPLVFLLLAVSFLKEPSTSDLGPRAEPPSNGASDDVQGWQGELVVGDGTRWRATLGPLHADSARQRFDSRALGERFGLGEGQVYKLVLTDASPAAAGRPRELPLAPESLEVVDAEGTALTLLTREDDSAGKGPADPLRVLLSAPGRLVNHGESATWILWGRAPGVKARIAGLAGDASFPLEARPIPREQVDVALLRRNQ